MSRLTVEVDEKYTFILPKGDYRIQVLRYGEDWLWIDEGSNAVHALMAEVELLREKAKTK